jgi:transglutaminase-like putative cysteine protease
VFSKGYPQDKQITYAGMLWLLGAQLVVMIPLVFYLPIWLIPVLLFSAGWRIRVMKGHMEQPGIFIKLIIGGLGIAALTGSGMALVSLDMMASLLMLGFSYKALEIIQRRDGMVVILTGFLLIGVLFLYSQSILTTAYGIFALAVLTGAMIAIQQSNSHTVMQTLRLSSSMLMLCLPLMIMFFLFAPRFPPLWTVPLSSGNAKTGMTDRMTPGDIANLSQSDDLAFSVKFFGERPKQSELYWRGIVLQHFDGNTWTQFAEELNSEVVKSKLRTNVQALNRRLVKKGDSRKYEVIYEKSSQSWLFALSPVLNIKGDAFYGSDFRIIANRDIIEPMMLTLVSYPEALREVNLPASSRNLALQLPEHGNEKSRALAQRLFASSSSKQDYIEKILNRYQQQAFYYTLRPPLLNRSNSIDDFLLNSRKGFCEHYAGSFVFMMRAAGIPSRVIVGYQGGEWNDNGHFLAVHQYDAHAWTEVWLEGQGWVRLDPTAMVAPDRVEKNLETAVSEEGSFLEEQAFSMTKSKWLNNLRKRLDSTQYAWRRFVLGYDKEAQAQFLERLFGEMSVQKIAVIVGGLFAAIILLWVMFLGLGRRHSSEAVEHQLYRRFCDLLEKQGVKRKPSQTPQDYSHFASAQLPGLTNEINAFTRIYSTLCYQPDQQTVHQQHISKLKTLLKNIKKYR